MKVRFIIKEAIDPADVKSETELKTSIQTLINTLDGAKLAAFEKYGQELLQPGSQGEIPDDPLAEEKEKTDCFATGRYKTFEGKSKCIQRTKGLTKNRADAYTASVLRNMGELPKKKK